MPAFQLLVAFVTVLVVGAILPSSAAADRNCDEFSSHDEASAYFATNDGSPGNNVDAMDGDGDGVPCESLIRHGGLRGAVESVRDGNHVAVTTLVLGAGGALAGIVYLARRYRMTRAGLPQSEPLVAAVHVPPLTNVAPTGILAISVPPSLSGTSVKSPDVLVRSSAGRSSRHALDAQGEVSIVVPEGAYEVSLGDSDRVQSAIVVAGDVTRVEIPGAAPHGHAL